MAMRKREDIIAAVVGGAVLLAVAGLFFGTHYRALLHPGAAGKVVPEGDQFGLTIPTIDEMCKAVGATSANLDSCKNDESAAAEFVIAWMGLHGFVANGTIDSSLIQLAEDIGTDPASPLINPDAGLIDPSLGDPSLGDPNAAETGAEPNIDPATGLPVTDSFESPSQIAKFCLGDSMDWLQLHDCISRYDPSSRFDGN
jgi:hypothetical protein